MMAEPYDTYKKLRNNVSELSFEESFAAAWAFSQYVQIRNFSFPRDVERHRDFTPDGHFQPYMWQLETMMREVVLNSSNVNQRGKSLKRWVDVAATFNQLRALEDVLHEMHLGPDNVLFEMLRISHQQFQWQRLPNTRLIGRYYRIFNAPEVDAICQKLTKLSVQKIYAIGSGLWGSYTTKAFLRLPLQIEIANITQADLDAFFAMCATDVYALRQTIKAAHVVDDTFSYDNRFLRASPLIKFSKEGEKFMACPLPTHLYWRFTSGLYYDLTANPNFFNALGASFQQYVGDLLGRSLATTALKYLPEEKYGKRGNTKDTVDWVLLGPDAAAFIECKSKRLSLGAKANLVSRDALTKDIGILADAVVQLYKTINEYKANRYPSLGYDAARVIVPVVVTLENWFPLEHAVIVELNKHLTAKLVDAGIPDAVLTEMPYVIASCDELEEAVQIIAKVGISKFFARRTDEKYRGWMLEGYMSDAFKAERNAAVDLFAETYDEILQPFR